MYSSDCPAPVDHPPPRKEGKEAEIERERGKGRGRMLPARVDARVRAEARGGG